MLGGVATGLADWLGIDPVLVRVVFVVLAVFGGSGILVYLALWLFLPEEGQAESSGERFLRDNTMLAVVLAVLLAVFVVGPALVWGGWGRGPGFLGVMLLVAAVVAAVALARRGTGEQATGTTRPSAVASESPSAPQPAMFGAAGSGSETVVVPTGQSPVAPVSSAPPPAPTPPPKPPRDRSVLGLLTVSVALVVVGALVLLRLSGMAGVTAVVVVGSALLVVALGLLVGSIAGRARGLIALGVVLVLVLVPLAAVPRGIHAGDGAGDRHYQPTTVAELADEYRLGGGTLTLDLTDLDLNGTTQSVDVSVGAGEIRVWLPARPTAVTVEAQAGVGGVSLPGQDDQGGLGVDQSWSVTPDDAGGSQLDLSLEVGLGQVQVVTTDVTAEVTR